MVQEELRGKYLHITFGDVSPIVVNDVAGLEFLATQTQVGTPMNYIIWLASVNGYFYQVYVYASAKVPLRTLKKTVEEGQCCFALLDPDKVAHVKGGGTSVGRIASRIFGYSADLSGTPWALWKGGDGDLSHAEFAFCFGETRFFGVFPLDLGRVEPDRAALCKALLYFLSMDDRRIALYKVGPVRIGALRGFSCRYSAKFGRKKREYLMTVVRQGPVALLLGGWSTIGVEGVEDLRRAFQRFRFDQTSPMVEDRNTWSEKLKEAHHQALHEMAVSYSRRGNAHLAEIYFRRALEFGVTDLALKNLYWILSAGERYGDALKVLDRFKAAVDGSPALRMARAFLLSKLGRLDEAFGIYRSVFDGGFRSDKGFLHYFVFLCEAQGLEAGVSAALRYMKGGDSILVAAGVARVLVIERKEKRAIEVMTSLWRRSGLNSILYNLINALMDKGFFAEVVSVCRLLEENGDDSAFVPFSRGKAEFVQKLFLKARVSFETALRRSPDEEEIQRYLAVVKMKLGQGETNLVDAVVEPVAIPAEDLAVSTGKKLPERYGRCDAYLDTRIMAVAYEKDKAYRESEFKRIVVRTGLGARRLNTLSFSFNPLFEKLYCNYLVVKDMNGKVLARSNRADWYVLDAGGGEASNRKILHIPVPGLRPDCAIELCVTRSNLYPPSSFPLTRMVFSSSLPCVRASLLLMGSRKGLRERIRGDIVRSDGEDYIRWSLDHPKTIPAEPYAVSPYAYLPSLVLWDETNTWNSEVCSYLDMIGHRLAPSSEVEAKAAELTRGLRTAEEKMEVLARYVQKTLSYKAISFGLRGLIPKACEKTMLDRYGDCKAHAVLLHALLRAAGISSSLVLVDSGKSVMPDIAHAGQFNHMILYLPDSRGGGRFVDPVVKSLNLLTSPPPGLSGCKVLVVDRKTRGLRTIPDPSPERDAVHLKRKVRIIREGTLEVRETMTLTGVCAAGMRGMFEGVDSGKWTSVFQQSLAGRRPGVNVKSVVVTGLDNVDEAVGITTLLEVAGALRNVSGTWVGRLPALMEAFYIPMPSLKSRQSPFAFRTPLTLKSRVVFEIPESWTLMSKIPAQLQRKIPGLQWSSRWSSRDSKLHLDFSFHREARKYPASKYRAMEKTSLEGLITIGFDLALKGR
jgi:tetratricopeptide (TPR) repeat protein